VSVGLQRLARTGHDSSRGRRQGPRTRRSSTVRSSSTHGGGPCSVRAMPSRRSGMPRAGRVGEAIKGGAKPDGPEVAALRRHRVEAGRKIERSTRSSLPSRPRVDQLLLRIPNRPTRTCGRRRGVQRHRPGRGASSCRGAARRRLRSGRTPSRRRNLAPSPALGDRDRARHHRQPARGQDRRLRLPGLQGVGSPFNAR